MVMATFLGMKSAVAIIALLAHVFIFYLIFARNREEFHSAVVQMLIDFEVEVTSENVDEMFNTMDVDKGGSISFDEFKGWFQHILHSSVNTSILRQTSYVTTELIEMVDVDLKEQRIGDVDNACSLCLLL